MRIAGSRYWIAASLLAMGAVGALWAFSSPEHGRQRRAGNGSSSLTAADEDAPREAGWPMMFGPYGDGRSRETCLNWNWSPEAPPEKWRLAIGRGYSAPVAVGRDLILQQRVDDTERITCLDAETADVRWEHSYPTAYQCKYEYSDGPYASPLIDGDYVYAVGSEAKLHCLRRSDGTLVWQRALDGEFMLPERQFGFGAGMLVDNERLYLNVGGVAQEAGIVAFDKPTGSTLWTATDHAAAYTMPRMASVQGRRFLLVLTETGLVSLDPLTGHELSTFPYHSKAVDTLNAVTPVVVNDFVLLVAGPGPGAVGLRLLPEGEFATVWNDRRALDSQFNNVLHHAGFIYGFTSSRQGGATFRCLELVTGKMRWEYSSKLGRGQSIAVDGKVILLGERGNFGTLDLDPVRCRNARISERPILAAPCYSVPALHRGLLYIRNEAILLCIDLRQSPNEKHAAAGPSSKNVGSVIPRWREFLSDVR